MDDFTLTTNDGDDPLAISSGRCPRCGAGLQSNIGKPRVGAPGTVIRCSACDFEVDLSDPTSIRVTGTDVSINMPQGWINSIRYGKIPDFTVRGRDGSEVPVGHYLHRAGSIIRACSVAVFIGFALLLVFVLLLD